MGRSARRDRASGRVSSARRVSCCSEQQASGPACACSTSAPVTCRSPPHTWSAATAKSGDRQRSGCDRHRPPTCASRRSQQLALRALRRRAARSRTSMAREPGARWAFRRGAYVRTAGGSIRVDRGARRQHRTVRVDAPGRSARAFACTRLRSEALSTESSLTNAALVGARARLTPGSTVRARCAPSLPAAGSFGKWRSRRALAMPPYAARPAMPSSSLAAEGAISL